MSSAERNRETSDGTVRRGLFLAAGLELDRALMHHHKAISVVDRVLHVVGHHDGGDPGCAHGVMWRSSLPPPSGIERGAMLVQHQDLRF